jgi:hypothetical protein
MRSQDFYTLQRRVRVLERSLKFAVGACVGLGMIFIISALGTRAEMTPDVLRARGLIIVDDQGRERILIGAPIPPGC